MSDTVNIGQFSKICKQVLDEYKNLTYESLKKATDKTAREAVKTIKSGAPKRTGEYMKSWASKKTTDTSSTYGRTVYAKKPHYRLAHLLEHGHALKGYIAKRTTKTRVKAFPHIPSDDETGELFENNLKKEMDKL